jgi:glycosyltransferase involved in cell wall biosynthesis
MVKRIRVLQLSTHDEECGIARYQEQFVASMLTDPDIENVFFDVSPNKSRFMDSKDYKRIIKLFETQFKDFDVLHIQHELSFYKHDELRSMIELAHKMGKKVVVTIHTAFDVEYSQAKFTAIRPGSGIRFLKAKKTQLKFEQVHINPLKNADLIMVHNTATKESLTQKGYDPNRILVIRMPVPKLDFRLNSDVIHNALHYQKGDVIYASIGFISKMKGVDQALKALHFLPSNYKFAVIGGNHPSGANQSYLDELSDYIAQYKLQDRVYITGFIEDDAMLNALIRESDICVYPYDERYYSYVSSAALSNAFANHKAVIAYETRSFMEINAEENVVTFCKSPNYYELAKEIAVINIAQKGQLSKSYAEMYAYDKEAAKLAAVYRRLAV